MTTDDPTTEPSSGPPAADHGPTPHYEIRVDGHLGRRWATWLEGMALTNEDDGTTAISGPVVDQAALHGVLQKLRDLGITLRSLTLLDPDRGLDHRNDRSDHDTPGATS